MATFKYDGEGERVFPALGITVKRGDIFDAPSGFDAPNVIQVKTTKATPAVTEEITE